MQKNIYAQLENFATILKALIDSIPESKLHLKVNNEWSAFEEFAHLIKAQDIHIERLQQFIEQEHPKIKAYTPTLMPSEIGNWENVMSLTESFQQKREHLLGSIKENEELIWNKTADHEEFEPYNFRLFLIHVINVDHAHLFKIEQKGLSKS